MSNISKVEQTICVTRLAFQLPQQILPLLLRVGGGNLLLPSTRSSFCCLLFFKGKHICTLHGKRVYIVLNM